MKKKRFLEKLKTELSYDPVSLGYVFKKTENINSERCTPMFIAALFIVGKT